MSIVCGSTPRMTGGLLDELSVYKAEAEVRLTEAKVLALQKTVLDPADILPVLNAVLEPPKEDF